MKEIKKYGLVIIFLIAPVVFLNAKTNQCVVKNLRCEYLVNPLGIDSPNPRLFWRMEDPGPGANQTAWQIIVGNDSMAVVNGIGKVWDSGKVATDEMLTRYSGEVLKPFTKYFWSVTIWNNEGDRTSSEVASFETGMIDQKNWKGHWITDTHDFNVKPAPYFRKEFSPAKKVKEARAYIVAAGLYELTLNGEKVGDHRLDPMYTRFDRRNLYVTYDITELLNNGPNTVGVLLGNGWYNHQSKAVWYFDKAPWRARPKFCMDIRLVYEDGSQEVVSTGTDWKTAVSPVIFNSIYTAEHYDARKEIPGWNKPGFDDTDWRGAMLTGAPSKNIVSQTMVPVRNVEKFRPESMIKIDEYTYLFDFGQNMSGVTKIKANGPEGTTIRLKHAERLGDDGRVDMSNIDMFHRPTDDSDPFQTDIFILSGKKTDVFMPRFNYKGFQFVEVSSDRPINLNKESLTAFFMHSDVSPVGQVSTSNPILNKIWEATNYSYLSNCVGYPTDCPQREKNGWTGDAHINIETGLYNFDGITVYEKWLADHRDEQQPNGVLPAIIPTNGWGYEWGNGPDWTSTIVLIPWNIYLFYGDVSLLEASYENMKRYVDHISDISPSGVTSWGLGDWVPVKSKSSVELTSTCYYYADVSILAKAAKLLNKHDDSKRYFVLAQKIKNAFNEKFLNTETAIYASGTQTELSAPLYWGLVPENIKEKVASNLAKRVEADHFHLDVGLLGQKTILNALSENGYAEIAAKIVTQEDYPSWGWWIVNGATTLYENWDINAKNEMSMNHIMFGEIGAWLYKGLGGIFPDEHQPGFKNIILKPNFVKNLEHFKAKHESPYGLIVSSWEWLGDTIQYTVEIPPNSTAEFCYKGYSVIRGSKGSKGKERKQAIKSDQEASVLHLSSGVHNFSLSEK